MPRVRKGAARSRKHKKVLKSMRGYIGAASRRYRVAKEARLHAGQHATIGRKLKKRDFRRLWITRISAACRQRGLTYSQFIHALGEKVIAVNRKMLADLAVSDPGAFDNLVATATAAAPAPAKPLAQAAPVKRPPRKPPRKRKPRPRPPSPRQPLRRPPHGPRQRSRLRRSPQSRRPRTTSLNSRRCRKQANSNANVFDSPA